MKNQYYTYPACLSELLYPQISSKLLVNCILILLTTLISAQTDFYYSFYTRVDIEPIENVFTIEFFNEEDAGFLDEQGWEYEKLTRNLYRVEGEKDFYAAFAEDFFFLNQAYKINEPLYFRNRVVLSWREDTTEEEKMAVENDFGLQLLKETDSYGLYGLQGNALETSRMIVETNDVRYCVPEFYAEIEFFYIPNDTYFDKQYYLHNTGQVINDGNAGVADADIDAPEAWDITMGSPYYQVAVIDRGVTENHPDLPSSRQARYAGSNFGSLSDPSEDPDNPEPPAHDAHGNACAGIVGATADNSIGIAGVAPNTTIIPIRINNNSLFEVAQAIRFAVDKGASVISASIGYYENPDYSPDIIDAIQYGVDNGVVMVWAAGNNATPGTNGTVAFPANADIDEIIAVGASDRNNQKALYSPVSAKIDIAAPSSHSANICWTPSESADVWTIDNPGSDGYNPFSLDPTDPALSCFLLPGGVGYEELPSPLSDPLGLDFSGRFWGTSAAAPQVAGVAALMLSLNECFTPAEIKHILINTADKVGGYNYNWSFNRPGHSLELGYGKLNAFQAVQQAQCPNFLQPVETQLVFCEGETVQLQVNNFLDDPDSDCFEYTYQWSPTDGVTDPNSLSTELIFPTVSIDGVDQLYTLTATSIDDPSCTIQTHVSVHVPCTNSSPCACSACSNALLEVGVFDAQICNQSSTQFYANVLSGDLFTYQWSPAYQLDDATSPAPVYSPVIGGGIMNGSVTKTFTVTATSVDNPQCKLTKTVSVEVQCGNGCPRCMSIPYNPDCQARMKVQPGPAQDNLTIKVEMGRRYLPPVIWGGCPIPPFSGDVQVIHLATGNIPYQGKMAIGHDGRGSFRVENTENWPQGLFLIILRHQNNVLALERIFKL